MDRLINHKTFRLISDNIANATFTTDVEPLDPSARGTSLSISYNVCVVDVFLF